LSDLVITNINAIQPFLRRTYNIIIFVSFNSGIPILPIDYINTPYPNLDCIWMPRS